MTAAPVPPRYRAPETSGRIALIAASFEHMIGRPLVMPGDELVAAMWDAPHAIVAYGTEPDPIFFFGNRVALAAFETDAAAFTALPSRLSAEALQRGERQLLLDRASQDGFIDDYAGLRISATGRRFRIERAIVWNLVDAEGVRHGQAATFAV